MAISDEQIEEFRTALEQSARPMFFFDGDVDGLSSYTLLYRFKREGKGIMISGRPRITEDFARKYNEYQPDCVFILDLAQITQEFIDAIKCPIYWLDHHDPDHPELHMPKQLHYFNPRIADDSDGRPTSLWAYKIAQRKEDLWIALAGIIGDYHFEEELVEEFREWFPDLLSKKITHQGEALFESKLGELIQILNFNLKGSVSRAMTSVKIFTRIEHPDEILKQESSRGKYLYKCYSKVANVYQKIVAEALAESKKDEDFIIFTYQNEVYSISGDVANEVKFRNKEKAVIIGRRHDEKVIMSLRSENFEIIGALKSALEGIDGHGGGHPKACGAVVPEKDFDDFVVKFKESFLEHKKEQLKLQTANK